MATKEKIMRLLQEMRGLADITRRHPAPKPSPLFLMQLRSHLTNTNRPRHRLVIGGNISEAAHFPIPVKITHLTADSGV